MEDDEIDLMALIETLRRQMGLIFATIILSVALAAVYLFSVTPIFTASSLILFDPSQKNLLDPNSASNVNLSYAAARVDSEVEILRSDTVALAVVSEQRLIADPEFGPQIGLREKLFTALGIQKPKDRDPKTIVRGVVQKFKNATSIRRKGSTFLMTVSVSSASPDRAAQLANALSNSYITQQVEAKIRSSLSARDVLQKQIDAQRAALAKSEDALDRFIQQNLTRIEAETGSGDVASLAQALDGLKASRLQNEVKLTQAQTELSNKDWNALATNLESQALAELERQRAGIQQRLGRVVAGSQAEVDLRAEVAALENKLAQASAQELSSLRKDVTALSTQEAETRRNLRETLIASQLPSDLLAKIFEIQQDASNARAQYQNLLSRKLDLETQAGVQIADSRLVSAALPPTGPSFPKKRLVLALALVLGGGLGVFFAFMKEFFIGGFTSPDQLQDAIQAPVVAEVPLAANLARGELSPADKVVKEPLSNYSEAIRRLRASVDQNLQKMAAKDGGALGPGAPVILIASTVPNEGKTTTALALARTYALAGKRVLLIDSDLRKPSLHQFIGAEPSSGFLDYLRNPENRISMKEFSSADSLCDLTLVLGRTRSATPTDQLLSSVQFEEVIKAARKTFDIVILDSPPLLPVIDAHYLAKHANIVVMVVRWASTGQRELRAVRSPLRDAMRPGAPLLTILSHKEGGRGRGYNYHYGYGDETS
jgi:polysaccharide biosynthesis transport protein